MEDGTVFIFLLAFPVVPEIPERRTHHRYADYIRRVKEHGEFNEVFVPVSQLMVVEPPEIFKVKCSDFPDKKYSANGQYRPQYQQKCHPAALFCILRFGIRLGPLPFIIAHCSFFRYLTSHQFCFSPEMSGSSGSGTKGAKQTL